MTFVLEFRQEACLLILPVLFGWEEDDMESGSSLRPPLPGVCSRARGAVLGARGCPALDSAAQVLLAGLQDAPVGAAGRDRHGMAGAILAGLPELGRGREPLPESPASSPASAARGDTRRLGFIQAHSFLLNYHIV